jgi:hypothetical protein
MKPILQGSSSRKKINGFSGNQTSVAQLTANHFTAKAMKKVHRNIH